MPFGIHSHLSATSSAASSRPSSRASSPTRSGRSVPVRTSNPASGVTTPAATDSDPLDDYFGHGSGASTPAVGSYTGSSTGLYTCNSDAWTPGPYPQTPGGGYFHVQPVEIVLDSDALVMRGQGGDMNPAYLSGSVELNLAESTNIKEISLSLHGKAKVQFSETTGTGSKNHHYTHPVLVHDWSFLQGDKKHNHTLKSGHHSFPFSLMIDGKLPSSIHTYQNDAMVQYKLKANVVRAGFASNFHAVRSFSLHRTFTPEALEFNQTLEIENTWPGKIMYSLTLPFKAYAAGDDIPVNVKFMPLAKGVRVMSVSSVIKEYSLVHTRHSSHANQRVAASVKHEMQHGQAVLVQEESIRPPNHWPSSSYLGNTRSSRSGSVGNSSIARPPVNAQASSSRAINPDPEVDDDPMAGDDEVNTHFSISIPPWTTPSHTVHPVFITHKIKWSCALANADGHISELRCALPIVILDSSLIAEARAAGATTRNLLFGGEGNTGDVQQIDLPSYSNHVYDRVAVADSGGTSGFLSRNLTPSTSITPPVSRGPSRPGSPTEHRQTDADEIPPRRQLSSWADSELLVSLGALQTHSNGSSPRDTPAPSRGPSRPLSRRSSRSGISDSRVTSRAGSRTGSRANSPERSSTADSSVHRSSADRRPPGGTLANLFHIPSSMKTRQFNGASRPILRNSSHAQLGSSIGDNIQRNSVSFTNIPDRGAPIHSAAGRSHHSGQPAGRPRFELAQDDPNQRDEAVSEESTDPINRVPSYAIASRGFLGGGVVPLDSTPPTYDASERSCVSIPIVSHRSDTALVDLGALAHTEAEERAGGEI